MFDDCLFENPELLNIYKSILFFEGSKYASEISKKDFNFSKDTAGVYQLKQKIKSDTSKVNYNMEKVFVELKKIFVLRKHYIREPLELIQNRIADVRNYTL